MSLYFAQKFIDASRITIQASIDMNQCIIVYEGYYVSGQSYLKHTHTSFWHLAYDNSLNSLEKHTANLDRGFG